MSICTMIHLKFVKGFRPFALRVAKEVLNANVLMRNETIKKFIHLRAAKPYKGRVADRYISIDKVILTFNELRFKARKHTQLF